MKTWVKFRGEDKEVEFTATDEPDVNYFCVEWYFPDLDGDAHAALNVTAEEEETITDACADAYQNYDPGGDE
jgi:hypothetical protein